MSKIDFAKVLNEEQYQAVTVKAGPCLVLAGAGSGKTRVLVHKVAWLIEQGVKPEKILLLTFTNKAANEMMSRTKALLGLKDADRLALWGGTFHSVANRLLRVYGRYLDIPNNFVILDSDDSKSLLKKISKNILHSLDKKNNPSSSLIQEVISFATNSGISLNESLQIKFPEWLQIEEQIVKIAEMYKQQKQKSGTLDFDDLLQAWKKLTTTTPTDKIFANLWEYILVDEYQDTNTIQAEIIYNLAKAHQNILVVGDDAQSIYSFRAANIQNILDFPKIFPKCQIIKLEKNYRSSPEIVSLANAVIADNVNQFAKNLQSVLNPGLKPELIAENNNFSEAKFLADKIEYLLSMGLVPQEIAVLFRASHHSQNLEIELNKRGINYEMRGGLKFFERAHIKDVLAHLKVLFNFKDQSSWTRILPLYEGIGDMTEGKIYSSLSQLDSLADLNNLNISLSAKADISWSQVKENFNRLLNISQENLGELIRLVMAQYNDYLMSQYTDYRQRQDDLEQLAIFASAHSDLAEFLSEVSLQEKFSVGDDKNKAGVILSTIHQAKGLEWQAVFLLNLTSRSLPHPLCQTEIEIEEERRLFYVAVTRAKRYLYLSYPLSEFRYDGYKNLQPSIFLSNLDSNLLNYNHLARSSVYAQSDGVEYVPEQNNDFYDEDKPKPKNKTKPGHFLPEIDEW